MPFDASALLDPPPFPVDRYASLADRLAALLATRADVLLIQGEAVIALEAVATSLARPGLVAVNVVTSPYGDWFGSWLRRGGATVVDVVGAPGKPVGADAVAQALAANPDADILSLVHAESASGILNPLPEIAAMASRHGAALVVDAVASFGGHPFPMDELGVEIAVIGPQKALGGSAGLSAVAVSPKAWRLLDRPAAARRSVLSLVDHRRDWLETGRGALPGTPSALEFHALEAALDRVEEEGLDAVVARHAQATVAARAGLAALGLQLWTDTDTASRLVTAALLPDGMDRDRLVDAELDAAGIGKAVGPGAERLIRLNHTGRRADRAAVATALDALAARLAALGA